MTLTPKLKAKAEKLAENLYSKKHYPTLKFAFEQGFVAGAQARDEECVCKEARERLGPAGYKLLIELKELRERNGNVKELVEALRKAILWAECCSGRLDTREGLNWSSLNKARAVYEKWKENNG